MSDIKIRPPAGPTQGAVERPERADPTEGRAFELGETGSNAASESPTATPAVSAATDPAALVQELRAGRIDMEQAVDILIEQALKAQPVAAASESMRQEIRQALRDLVRDDPTLASLAASMKR